jgi:hypothetical protein
MTPFVTEQVPLLLPRRSTTALVVHEVPVGQGIADVVAVRFDCAAVRHRLDRGVGPISSPLRVRALLTLRPDRVMRVETLARKISASPRSLLRSTLTPLAELGLVELLNRSKARSTGAWRPVDAHVTAVELKLSNWRKALRQADNLAFGADRSWVVLDEGRAASAATQADQFRAFGVGLAVVGPDTGLRIVARPAGRRPERWLRALVAESAWSLAESEVAASTVGF